LEYFDLDDNSKWYMTPNSISPGGFDGSPYGCNANQNTEIDAGDLTCIGIRYFGGTCSPTVLAAGATATASLAVSSDLAANLGEALDVPITLSTGGNAVAAAAFAIDFDANAFAFDSTDADSDGIPDAVTLNVPSGLFTMVNFNATESRVEIIISGMAPPFPLLADGTLATIQLSVKADASGVGDIALTNSSLGSDEGQPVPLEITNGTVSVPLGIGAVENFIFLPAIQR
jgi:hypothetical protein